VTGTVHTINPKRTTRRWKKLLIRALLMRLSKISPASRRQHQVTRIESRCYVRVYIIIQRRYLPQLIYIYYSVLYDMKKRKKYIYRRRNVIKNDAYMSRRRDSDNIVVYIVFHAAFSCTGGRDEAVVVFCTRRPAAPNDAVRHCRQPPSPLSPPSNAHRRTASPPAHPYA